MSEGQILPSKKISFNIEEKDGSTSATNPFGKLLPIGGFDFTRRLTIGTKKIPSDPSKNELLMSDISPSKEELSSDCDSKTPISAVFEDD